MQEQEKRPSEVVRDTLKAINSDLEDELDSFDVEFVSPDEQTSDLVVWSDIDFTKYSEPVFDTEDKTLYVDIRELSHDGQDLAERIRNGWIDEIFDKALEERLRDEARELEEIYDLEDDNHLSASFQPAEPFCLSGEVGGWYTHNIEDPEIFINKMFREFFNPFSLEFTLPKYILMEGGILPQERTIFHEQGHWVHHMKNTRDYESFSNRIEEETANQSEYSNIYRSWFEAISQFEEDPLGTNYRGNRLEREDFDLLGAPDLLSYNMEFNGDHLFNNPYKLANIYQTAVFMYFKENSRDPLKETRSFLTDNPVSPEEMEDIISYTMIERGIPDFLGKVREYRELLEEENGFDGEFAAEITDLYDELSRESDLRYEIDAFHTALNEAAKPDYGSF